jgi:hypothetical protein
LPLLQVEINDQPFGDYHGVVVRCAAKGSGTPELARIRFPLTSEKFFRNLEVTTLAKKVAREKSLEVVGAGIKVG